MPTGTHYTPEQIIGKLRETELEVAKGLTASQFVNNLSITEQTYYPGGKNREGFRPIKRSVLSLGERKRPSKTAFDPCETGQNNSAGRCVAKLLSSAKRRQAVDHTRNRRGRVHVSERRACRVLGQPRSTKRHKKHLPSDQRRLLKRIVELAGA